MIKSCKLAGLIGVFSICLLTSTASNAASAEPMGDKRDVECSVSRVVVNLVVGLPLEEAVKRSPALGTAESGSFLHGQSAYVFQPFLFRYEGLVPFEVSCPHQVAVMPKAGRVYSIEVDMTAHDPYDLNEAMELMSIWRDKFSAMNLPLPVSAANRRVMSFERTKAYFESKSTANLPSPGQSTGAWQQGHELIGLGIQRVDLATSVGAHKFMYVVELSVSDESPENMGGGN